ncbi:alanine racemase [Clostridium botulinum B str. Osaka05]|uniref:Alanine racemase n=1 Tax=Clostridium botulinum B str. Osaka05 TaxID=1407017 RepID=A0A0S6TX54_CLOBO|nr:alanine racemase [Clostridium botulinum]GAE00718.1 alanine racemase [Clostridium botulinum B str. Osaka05]
MFEHSRPAWIEINLDNLIHNMKEIRRVAKSKEIISVVKADAYGHGASEIASILLENGANRLAVAVLSEALELRNSGITAPIIILGYTPLRYDEKTICNNAETIIKNDLEVSVSSYKYAEQLSKKAQQLGRDVKIHVNIDTGMGRLGFLPTEENLEKIYQISKLPNIIFEGLFSHFSTADEKNKDYTNEQFKKFLDFYYKLKDKNVKINIKHIANSAALIDLPYTHLDAVRPGIAQYGYYPSSEVNHENINLRPTITLKTNIVLVKDIKSGQSISYGRRFRTIRNSKIAVLPIGYADGYERELSDTDNVYKTQVIVNGRRAPIVGRITMDMCMIDVTDVGDVKVGDEVILIGECNDEKIAVEDIADLLHTIPYEVTSRISKRIPRYYIQNGKIVKTSQINKKVNE